MIEIMSCTVCCAIIYKSCSHLRLESRVSTRFLPNCVLHPTFKNQGFKPPVIWAQLYAEGFATNERCEASLSDFSSADFLAWWPQTLAYCLFRCRFKISEKLVLLCRLCRDTQNPSFSFCNHIKSCWSYCYSPSTSIFVEFQRKS